jgi:two-component system LytT family response regulator
MKILIVDDEADARELLHQIISEHCSGIDVIEQVKDVASAVKILNKKQFDIVFLDIEMPNENGFALFEYFENPTFETIFCTAYSQYAIDAFKVSAIDYLMKPIGIEQVQNAIEKAIKTQGQNLISQRLSTLKDNIHSDRLQKIALPSSDGLTFVPLKDIQYFEADGSYTKVHTISNSYLVSKKIKEFEGILSKNTHFFRVHRSYLINVHKIVKYNRSEGITLEIKTQDAIPVGREKKAEFEEIVKSISI